MLLSAALVLSVLAGQSLAAEPAKQAPKVVLKSADGKKSYDLEKLVADGPVLVLLRPIRFQHSPIETCRRRCGH